MPEGRTAHGRQPLPRQVIVLSWVSFFADVSGEMIYPLLPLFLVGVLGSSATSMGWVEGVATATIALMTAWAGWRSDRVTSGARHRLVWVRWGYGLPILGKALLAAATAWPLVLIGRTIDRTGKGFRSSPRDALIADAVTEDQRGRAFGFHRALDTAGALTGVLLAAGLLWWLSGWSTSAPTEARPYRIIFAIGAAFGLTSLAVTFLATEPKHARAPQAAEKSTPGSPAAHQPGKPALLGMSGAYWRTLALLLIFALANSSDTFLLLRASDIGLSPLAVILLYALFNLTYAAISYPAGLVSDRLGRWRVIGLGWTIYAGVYVGFALSGGVGVWPLMALYGVFMGLTDGVGKALIADHAPQDQRGKAMGIFYMSTGLATLAASLLAGVLWDHAGHRVTFYVAAGLAGLAVVMIPVLHRKGKSA